jgi:hypothetical protein
MPNSEILPGSEIKGRLSSSSGHKIKFMPASWGGGLDTGLYAWSFFETDNGLQYWVNVLDYKSVPANELRMIRASPWTKKRGETQYQF